MNISFQSFKESKSKLLRLIAHTCKPKVLFRGGSGQTTWAIVVPQPTFSLIKTYVKTCLRLPA